MRPDWSRLSQAERDASYDNNRAVANSAVLIEQRNAASAAFRQAHADHLDVPYGMRDREKFDLYPAKRAASPCLVFIHGGYWQRNSREVFAMLVEGVAAHGWSVAIPGYTLAPEASLTQIVTEISRALDWLARNGEAYGIAGPMVLSGWSAGAQLVAMTLDHPRVAAGLAISGVYDLAPIRDTGLNNALKLPTRKSRHCRRFDGPSFTSGWTSHTALPNCRRWSSIQSGFMTRACPQARQACCTRSTAQTISAFSASYDAPTASWWILPES